MLTETGLPSIKQRVNTLTSLVVLKLNQPNDILIKRDAKKLLLRNKCLKISSAINNTLILAKNMEVPICVQRSNIGTSPPWALKDETVNLSLNALTKASTPNEIYQQMFLETLTAEKEHNWKFVFTDGSKTNFGTAFAVVDENGDILSKGLLPHFATVFSAEATAILEATVLADSFKTVICTDSLSTLTAITNINNKTSIIVAIRDKLIKNQEKLKLLWIPGHVGIKGNENADAAAKAAIQEPLVTNYISNKKDIKNHIHRFWSGKQKDEWNAYTHYYKTINPDAKATTYPKNCPKNMTKAFIRLRLGHTLLTHGHLITRSSPPVCHHCNSNQILSTHHLIYECNTIKDKIRSLFSNSNLPDLISFPSETNVKKVYSLLSSLKLENSI